jgi:hypothetical protein
MPVSTDIDDDKLERLAADKGVGSFVKPDEPQRVGEGSTAAKPIVKARPTNQNPAEGATPRAEMKTVNLELPAYVWTDLKIRAAQRQTSLKHVVMTALVNDGVTIADADMIEDGRRLRGSATS